VKKLGHRQTWHHDVLVVEQNASLAMRHADSVCLLAQGRNVLSGSASELRDHAEVARILVG